MLLSFRFCCCYSGRCRGTISLDSPSPLSKIAIHSPTSTTTTPSAIINCCSRVVREQFTRPSLKYEVDIDKDPPKPGRDWDAAPVADGNGNGDGSESNDGVSGIRVPRPRYIAVSKLELLNAIVSTMFDSQAEADQFIHLSKCLDSILHAEHKCTLEEMRVDYDLTHSVESMGTICEGPSNLERKYGLNGNESHAVEEKSVKVGRKEEHEMDNVEQDKPCLTAEFHSQLSSSSNSAKINSIKRARVAPLARFQHAFVQLLYNAEFEELSVGDLLLTSALNTDYLLTLPIYVDWKRTAESNAIIYRRGYTTEKQKGLLTVEKLDYLQSKLLRRIFFLVAQPLGKVGIWLTKVLGSTRQKHETQIWTESLKLWLKKLLSLQESYSYDAFSSSSQVGVDHLMDSDLPIWLAAQRAATRYEGILSAAGPRDLLLRKLLMWLGLAPSTPKQAFDGKSKTIYFDAESCLRPIFLPRVSFSDIWAPASPKYCGNDLWKRLKTAISIFLCQSTLQEPAFKELILLYTKDLDGIDTEEKDEVPSLQLKIYEKIPIPDLPVIFPHKKLSFRILDAVRLDAATILGLLAYFINYKFEDILSSPSAVLLDIIAVTALVIYATRVVLGYKQTRDRYQLLVNKTLYEKTVASGFGSVHFLLDASEQQLYKESILAYAILLKAGSDQVTCASVAEKCEEFIYNVFKEKIEMPIDKAKNTLSRLGLVKGKAVDGESLLQAIPCSQACEILRQRWNSLIT